MKEATKIWTVKKLPLKTSRPLNVNSELLTSDEKSFQSTAKCFYSFIIRFLSREIISVLCGKIFTLQRMVNYKTYSQIYWSKTSAISCFRAITSGSALKDRHQPNPCRRGHSRGASSVYIQGGLKVFRGHIYIHSDVSVYTTSVKTTICCAGWAP